MISQLPAFNALLNASSALLLGVGYLMIRMKYVFAHKICMLAAFIGSSVFLASYIIYHLHVWHVRYPSQGAYRTAYLFILTTHTILAGSRARKQSGRAPRFALDSRVWATSYSTAPAQPVPEGENEKLKSTQIFILLLSKVPEILEEEHY